MVTHGLIAVGDIIAYRRTFPELGNLTVAKDVLVSLIIRSECLLMYPFTGSQSLARLRHDRRSFEN
jgi:hypothetical protein